MSEKVVTKMLKYDDFEIHCPEKACYFCDGGICRVSYNQLDECKWPDEFLETRIATYESYLEDIPRIIGEEFIDEQLASTKRNIEFFKSLRRQ